MNDYEPNRRRPWEEHSEVDVLDELARYDNELAYFKEQAAQETTMPVDVTEGEFAPSHTRWMKDAEDDYYRS